MTKWVTNKNPNPNLKMRFCCLCVPLRDGITILGFFSLIICVLQWILSTALNPDNDISFDLLKNKTDEIISLLEDLALKELAPNKTDIIKKQFESLKSNYGLMFNFVTGKFHLFKYYNISISWVSSSETQNFLKQNAAFQIRLLFDSN